MTQRHTAGQTGTAQRHTAKGRQPGKHSNPYTALETDSSQRHTYLWRPTRPVDRCRPRTSQLSVGSGAASTLHFRPSFLLPSGSPSPSRRAASARISPLSASLSALSALHFSLPMPRPLHISQYLHCVVCSAHSRCRERSSNDSRGTCRLNYLKRARKIWHLSTI